MSTTADGSVDVHQDIQDALDQAAGTPNGAIVYLPPGTYRVDSPLEVLGTSGVEVKTQLDDPGWQETRLSLGSDPEDYTELIGQNDDIAPRSLYDEQLARRLAR